MQTLNELREYLKVEKQLYFKKDIKNKVLANITNDHLVKIWKYVKYMRISEYFYNNRKNILYMILYLIYERRKNSLGNKLGFYICNNTLAKGVQIFHHGSIIINGYARIGENCRLHGQNCIGNNGLTKSAPIIGKNVDIGVGAKVIGDIFIADNVKIGAGAIVVKSCYTKGATLCGVPAREVRKEDLNGEKITCNN